MIACTCLECSEVSQYVVARLMRVLRVVHVVPWPFQWLPGLGQANASSISRKHYMKQVGLTLTCESPLGLGIWMFVRLDSETNGRFAHIDPDRS